MEDTLRGMESRFWREAVNAVLILVLMEDTLRECLTRTHRATNYVLILVLMEDTLRDKE